MPAFGGAYVWQGWTGRETGAIEQHFQYRIQRGRIASIRLVQPDVLRPDTAQLREYVELQVLPTIVEVESMTGR